MKKVLILTVFVFSSITVFAQTGSRHTESGGNFSICPPRDWAAQEVPGFSYKFFIGEAADGFAPNMNIVTENFDRALDEYVDLNIQGIKSFFPDAKAAAKQAFRTSGGINGYKISTVYSLGGVQICSIQYIFKNNSRCYIVTYGVKNDTVRNFQNMIDESARTFEFIN